MSRKKSKPPETEREPSEGWESLAEDGPSLPENPELEEALREAAAAVDAHQTVADASPAGDEPGEPDAELPEAVAAQLKATEDRLLRLQADFENFRRRATKERTESNQYGHQNLVKDLLATVDNLERATDHARQSEGGDLDGLLQGVELVQRELLAALTKHGVVRIEAEGQLFDPAVHEAMAQVPDDSVAANTVIEEMQTGYRLRDRLLRPARVIVSTAVAPESPKDDEAEQPEEAAGEAD
ncbi:MAG: nucleotide exchange factor GrpE [Deltaproteobacteria bacterium]|nr:nucleotide exchange factor GrpE [Deltaproteobacteria bacterium]MBW2359823.1 nucleotide exchange factor GrpE [Deltaproteobacteria bacterium]